LKNKKTSAEIDFILVCTCEKTKKVYNSRNSKLPCTCNPTQIVQDVNFLEIPLNNNIHVRILSFAYENALQLEDITGILKILQAI
jgi:hypothetical protein